MTSISTQAAVTYDTRALTGDAAPGTDPGVVYSGFSTPVINAAEQTAFRADLTGPGVDLTNDRGIWSEGGGSLALVAREGDAAPGTGVVFGSLLENPVLNGAGQIAFNDGGIWLGGRRFTEPVSACHREGSKEAWLACMRLVRAVVARRVRWLCF